jgi:hypothetical protein
MQSSLMINAAIIVAVGIALVSTNSIALQCYNDNKSYKEERDANYNWVLLNLLSAIIVIFYGFYQGYRGYISY